MASTIRKTVLGASLVLGALGCSRDASAPVAPEIGCVLLGPSTTPTNATLHVGDTLRVTAQFSPCPALPNSIAFRWRSTDTLVATVDSLTGLVRARRLGTASINAWTILDPAIQGTMALAVVP
jgi:hypothetical protein